MAEPVISPVSIGEWWGMAPDGALQTALRGIAAAVWSGEPADVTATPDPRTTIVAFALVDYDVEVFKDGRLVSNRRWQPGQCQVMEAGVDPRAVLKSPWKMLHVYLPQTLLDEAATDGRRSSGGYALHDPLGRDDSDLRRLCMQISREVVSQTETSRLKVEGMGCVAAAHLIRRWSTLGSAPSRTRAASRHDLRRSIALIEERFAEDISLEQLAVEAGLSPFQFLRAFKSATGLPPHRYQSQLRLRRAQELLAESDLTVAMVAEAVGYADQGTLARLFKQLLDMTPGEYRREARR